MNKLAAFFLGAIFTSNRSQFCFRAGFVQPAGSFSSLNANLSEVFDERVVGRVEQVMQRRYRVEHVFERDHDTNSLLHQSHVVGPGPANDGALIDGLFHIHEALQHSLAEFKANNHAQ